MLIGLEAEEETEPTCVSVWIDGSQYAVVDYAAVGGAIAGRAAFILTDARLSVSDLKVE